MGICGGYQFLSQSIYDPDQIESSTTSFQGLGLLDLTVTMKREKHLAQVDAVFLPWEKPLTGYEIHHGRTEVRGTHLKEVMINKETSQVIGHSTLDGRVWGSYLHGLFDDNSFRREFLDHLRSRNGKKPLQKVVYEYDTDKAISNLAGIVRKSVNLERIYGDLNL